MRKFLTMATIAMMATAVATCLTACDDDEEGGSGSSLPSPTLTDSNGNRLQVKSISGGGDYYTFDYDDNGKLTSIGDYEFEGNSFKLTSDHSSLTVTLNSSGLITKLVEKIDYTDKYGSEKHNMTMDLKYNGNKQLTGGTVSGSGSYTSSYNDESESWGGSGTASVSWDKGNISKVVVKSKNSGTENGEKYSESYTGTYTFSYSNKENPFHQMPFYLAKDVLDIGDYGGVFAVLGLIGVGPNKLPDGYVLEEVEEDYGEDTETRTYTFKQNADGSIKTEAKNNGSTLTYSYNTLDTRAAIEEQLQNAKPMLELMGQKMFKRVKIHAQR